MTADKLLDEKYTKLIELLRSYGRLAVAFSGGVDSAFLLKAASGVLPPENIVAVTARAAIFPERELREAAELAAALGLRHLALDIDFTAIPQLTANPPDRCYHCKKALFQTMIREAGSRGFPLVADGGNLDDAGDFRPGARAVRELGVRSPLKDASLTKADIRALSAKLQLPTWNKPARACLASRFPYGQAITGEQLKRVEQAEELLLSHGFHDIRVRCHGSVARIEVGTDERPRFFDEPFMDRIDHDLRALGFEFVSLDLRGFRSGGFNHSVDPATLEKYRQ